MKTGTQSDCTLSWPKPLDHVRVASGRRTSGPALCWWSHTAFARILGWILRAQSIDSSLLWDSHHHVGMVTFCVHYKTTGNASMVPYLKC